MSRKNLEGKFRNKTSLARLSYQPNQPLGAKAKSWRTKCPLVLCSHCYSGPLSVLFHCPHCSSGPLSVLFHCPHCSSGLTVLILSPLFLWSYCTDPVTTVPLDLQFLSSVPTVPQVLQYWSSILSVPQVLDRVFIYFWSRRALPCEWAGAL